MAPTTRPFILFHTNFKNFFGSGIPDTRRRPSSKPTFRADLFLIEKLVESYSFINKDKGILNTLYASATTIGKWLSMSPRLVSECISKLSSNGYIATQKNGQYLIKKSLFKSRGTVAIYSDFLRKEQIKPMTKMVAILLWIFRDNKSVSSCVISKLRITRRSFQNHIRILRSEGILSNIDYTFIEAIGPVKERIQTSDIAASRQLNECERNDIQNVKETACNSIAFNNNNCINNGEYINLLGDTVSVPINTDPVVKSIVENEKKELEEKIRQSEQLEYIRNNCISLFENEYTMMFEDLNRIFPNTGYEPKVQAIYQTRFKASKGLVRNRLSYAIGIINTFERIFKGRLYIPTVARMGDIIKQFEVKKQAIQKVKDSANENAEQVQLEAMNREQLMAMDRLSLDTAIDEFKSLKDPTGYVFRNMDFEMAVSVIATDKEFVNKILNKAR